jgi:cytidylate kinase
MNVITVSREYGAGGGEVARRLAEALGWVLLDRELLHRAAEVEHMPDIELENLDEKALSMADRFSLHPPHKHYIHGLSEATRMAAARGNVVLVGRGTRQLLGESIPAFHLRMVAPVAWRARRMAQLDSRSLEQALARCAEVDRTRERFTRYFFGKMTLQSALYDLVVNSERVALDDVAAIVSVFVRDGSSPGITAAGSDHRVLTLAREAGAEDVDFIGTLADRLHLRVYDRELLEQEAVRLGLAESDLAQIDEQPAGMVQRFRAGSLQHRYFEALGQLMKEFAKQGNVLLVGRGSNQFLQDHPGAFHVRLVAPLDVRVRRVMERRWMREEAARQWIVQSDNQRRRFLQTYFSADWSDPLAYHVTANSGRLGPAAVDLIAGLAERTWRRTR